MNLHGIVSGSISAVNPSSVGTVRVSTGDSVSDDGTPTPSYKDVTGVSLQVQALTFSDIHQIEGLNLNGTRRAIYLNGRIDGLVRAENKGGDLIVMPQAQFVGSIDDNVLTVETVFSGAVNVNDTLTGDGVTSAKVVAFVTGSGGAGTYTIDGLPQTIDSQAMQVTQTWLVALVLEQWGNWVKVAATLQNGA